jgi:hypothetical protein
MLLCIFTSIDITQLDLSFLVLVNITVAKITNTYFIHFQMEYVFVDNNVIVLVWYNLGKEGMLNVKI